jgi:hypothetical protein
VKSVAGVSDWLTVTPTSSGASSDTLTLTAGALSVGTYSATIQVTAGALITSIPVTYIVTPNLVIAENGPDFKAIVGQANLPAPANLVVASISGATVSYSTSVKYGTGASNWLTISGNTAPGTLTLAPSTMTMPVGKKFSATVTLTPAHGTAINVPVTYEVDTSSLDLPSEPLEYTIDASSTAIDSVLKRTITTSDSGVPVTWTAVPLSPWVTVTPSSGTSGTTVTVTIDPAQLATVENGLVPNSIVFTYDGPGFTGAITSKTVLLHLLLPTVDVVAPYVAYVSEQKPVVIRGSGFKQPGVTTIMFDTLAAQSVDIVSDTEMHVVPPLVSTAGRLIASVPNALGSPRPQAELVVREHPNYAYAALDTSVVGSSNYNIVYDAERDAVITARGVSLSPSNSSSSTVQRFSYDAGTHTWTRTAKSFTELYDVALSLDGKTLFALTTSKLYFLDPVTLDTTLDVALPRPPFGSFPQLAAMNDKNLLIASNGLNYTLRYNYLSGIPLGSGGIASSLDGSLAYFSASAGISTYKASTSSVSTPVLRQPLLAARVNRDGSRVLIDGTLYNGIFNFIGKNNSTAGFLLQADSLSPDGTRVYEYENGSTPAKIHVLDATTFTYPNPLNELSTIPLIDNPGSAHSIVSLDGKALFIIGDQKFIVQPVP